MCLGRRKSDRVRTLEIKRTRQWEKESVKEGEREGAGGERKRERERPGRREAPEESEGIDRR